LKEILLLALGGALGSISRYGLSGFTQRLTNSGFPFGTLTVNILGSLMIGFIMQIGLNTDLIPRSLRIMLTLGFLGAFTTFSTFSYETIRYFEDGAWITGSLNVCLNVILCLGATLIGMAAARLTAGGV
jgi:fluoride exporter